MDQNNFHKVFRILGLGLTTALALGACLAGFVTIDSFYLQHERAAARWKQREPYHYRYAIQIDGNYFSSGFQIEILNNKIVQTINLDTGEPAETWRMAPGSYLHTTGLIREYMLIDGIFKFIEASRKPPKDLQAFLNRTNPTLYAALVYRGLLPKGKTSCTPAFPKVSYNRDYGYPEELALGANPCTLITEQRSPIYIWIDDFQVLP